MRPMCGALYAAMLSVSVTGAEKVYDTDIQLYTKPPESNNTTCLRMAQVEQNYRDGEWCNVAKTTDLVYSDEGVPLVRAYQGWDTVTGGWGDSVYLLLFLDSLGRPVEYDQCRSRTDTAQSTYRETYSYDPTHRKLVSQEVYLRQEQGDWVPYRTRECFYNEEGLLDSTAITYNTGFVSTEAYTYLNDTAYTIQYASTASSFEQKIRYEFIFSAGGKPLRRMTEFLLVGEWYDRERTLYSYDGTGLLHTSTTQKETCFVDCWIDTTRSVTSYGADGEGHCLMQVDTETRSADQWVPHARTIGFYPLGCSVCGHVSTRPDRRDIQSTAAPRRAVRAVLSASDAPTILVEGTIAIREVECFNLAGRYVMSRANPALTKEVRIPLAKGAALTEYQHLILRVTLVDGCRRYARLALRH